MEQAFKYQQKRDPTAKQGFGWGK